VPEVRVIGALARVRERQGTLPKPEDADPSANALLMLHRSAVLKVGADGKITLDDAWVRSWARASRLGQGTPGAEQDGLAARVAARRRAALRSLCADGRTSVMTVIAKPMGAVVTGTGAGGIRDVGIELHGTYGWPVLPGSTLKGVAHSFARDEAQTPRDVADAVFGAPPGDDEPARAGAVAFLDALPGPGVTVAEHVLTPHTRGYRLDPDDPDNPGDPDSGSAPRPPAEYINPVPIPFLVLTGEVFHIHLAGPRPEVGQAADLLAEALGEIGLGAKTTSGYGYFVIDEVVQGVAEPPASEAQRKTSASGTGRRR
jgi:CRISPR type III-B/RAMP module RAMP protein Cmr6